MSKEILETLNCFIFVPANCIEKDHAVFMSLSWSSYQKELFTDPQKQIHSKFKKGKSNEPHQGKVLFNFQEIV